MAIFYKVWRGNGLGLSYNHDMERTQWAWNWPDFNAFFVYQSFKFHELAQHENMTVNICIFNSLPLSSEFSVNHIKSTSHKTEWDFGKLTSHCRKWLA